ncbi:dickkopf-related protein 3-like isoform X1 [Arapaima gigas]
MKQRGFFSALSTSLTSSRGKRSESPRGCFGASPPQVAIMRFALFLLLLSLLGVRGSDVPHTPETKGDLPLQEGGLLKENQTEHQLEENQYGVDNESLKGTLDPHEENISLIQLGNETNHLVEKMDKVMDNKTGAAHFSGTLIQSGGQENGILHECTVDKDCEDDHYCQYEMLHSKCLPCRAAQKVCTSDEQCCGAQLCRWGQCTGNTTKGQPGTICQYQSDCSAELCCAFHKGLLLPVCVARPLEHQRCRSHPNHLMALLSWDTKAEGPQELCPCATGLQCQSFGRGSLCLQQQSSSSEEDLTETLYSEIDYII